MRISKLEIRDFRSHTSTVVDLDNGINVFVGTNDAGKSNVIRALEWVLYNTPAGDSVIRKGTKYASVKLHLDSGVVVERIRGRFQGQALNRYTLHTDAGATHFDAIGRDVPDAVKAVLGVSYYVEPGETLPCGLNLSRQNEQSFLLGKAPGKRAATLNYFTGAIHLDNGAKALKSDIREVTNEQKIITGEIEKYQDQLSKFSFLKDAGELIEVAQDADKRAREAEAHQNLLTARTGQFDAIVAQIEALPNIAEMEQLPTGEDAATKARFLIGRLELLNDLLEDIDSIDAKLAKATTKQQEMQRLSYQVDSVLYHSSIVSNAKDFDTIIKAYDAIEASESQIATVVSTLESDLRDLVNDYEDTLVANGVCPTCNGRPDSKKIRAKFNK